MPAPQSSLQLRTLITDDGHLRLSLVPTPVPSPGPDDVVVRIEAAPINPSDIGLLFGAADMRNAVASGTQEAPEITAPVPVSAMPAMKARAGQSLPAGNEGAGTVVAAGTSPAAQALLGRTVAVLGGAMYSQHRTLPVTACLPLPDGTPAAAGASCFVNPLTALGMVETMRREGHSALVHTAAASNLGQMLNRICLADGIALVNIVRKPDQARLLRSQGAVHVCDSSRASFIEDLVEAAQATQATLGFDAIGGGRLAGQILGAMETAISRRGSAGTYSRYGSAVHKQVYLYGSLDTSPTEIQRNFGMSWGLGGWLLFQFLERVGDETVARLKQRVVDELHTTFESRYARTLSLAQMLSPEAIAAYGARNTGAKMLVNPNSAQ